MTGRVESFEDSKGWGHLVADDGTRYFFHCTAIADGTRSIAEGIAVAFEVIAGHQGRWEATDIRPA